MIARSFSPFHPAGTGGVRGAPPLIDVLFSPKVGVLKPDGSSSAAGCSAAMQCQYRCWVKNCLAGRWLARQLYPS
jgi:hypothetical protein